MSRPDADRRRMVERHLAGRDITDPRVLEVMGLVPRELFVPSTSRRLAYADCALPIGVGQTISQPYIVALMAQSIEPGPDDRVLEIGTGSGYGAAVLSRLVAEVFTVERHVSLADTAAARWRDLGYDNISVRVGDGSLGWAEHAPYDGVVVTAAGPRVPPSLTAQLAVGGRLVMPVGPGTWGQHLVRLTRRVVGRSDAFERTDLGAVAFVPLVGAEGHPGDEEPWA